MISARFDSVEIGAEATVDALVRDVRTRQSACLTFMLVTPPAAECRHQVTWAACIRLCTSLVAIDAHDTVDFNQGGGLHAAERYLRHTM